MQDTQFQQRTDTITNSDILKRLPQLIDISTLSSEQQEFLQNHRQKTRLIEWLCEQKKEQQQILCCQKDFSVASSDIQSTEQQIDSLHQCICQAKQDLSYFEQEHSHIVKPLVQIGWPLIEAEEREKERQLLEEWRRQRYAKLNTVPKPITDNLRVSVSTKSAEQTSKTEPETADATNLKDKLINTLGSTGIILWYLICLLIAVMPLVMIDASFLLNLLLLAIMLFVPATSAFFWIWGLICAICGPQDAIAIIYYVLFVIMFLPVFINLVLNLFSKRK